ncbi:alpha-2-macroglobulin family protein [Filimonas effusa]|uniref:Alpha-2-macroglobulin domain-containing protein n=1 Tax=Filimonas effusa TaxID=2508721 RepID=A0A4Q1D5U6_9BACT|nr:alpha-2-macroglobulin family protein [Filimonas effusa]RXK82997.1 hypothetical protein ESB13_12790 [Filimonas effusa]
MKNSFLVCLIASLLSSFQLSAQQHTDSFPNQWREIDSLYAKADLPKSTLSKVKNLYNKAYQQKNEPQIIKTLIYQLQLTSSLSDNDNSASSRITGLQHEIPKAFSIPQKSILQTLLAKEYSIAYQEYSWKIRGRQTISNDTTADFTQWSATRFYQVIDSLWKEALTPAQVLKTTTISSYSPVIIRGTVDSTIQRDLYDLLLREALESYRLASAISFNFQPGKITEAAFLPAATFVNHDFTVSGPSDQLSKTLKYYQLLLKHHLNDPNPAALLDLDIDRIQWAFNLSQPSDPQRDSLYLNALNAITSRYDNEPAAAGAYFQIANYYAVKATGYNPLTDTANRYYYSRAKAIIEEQLARPYPESQTRTGMRQLLYSITCPKLSTIAEKINIPGQPFRLYVSYKNTTTLYGRLLRYNASPDANLKYQLYEPAIADSLLALPAYKQFSQTLPATNDYQKHSVEIKLDALPAGRYILVTSSDSSFSKKPEQLSIQPFDVTNISYIYRNNSYFVLDRETGKPLAGCNVLITPTYWDSKTGTQKDKPTLSFRTNENGYFQPQKINGAAKTILTWHNDTLVLEASSYYENRSGSPQQTAENVRVHFFTDRSIYRPGHTVFLKGIAVTQRSSNKQPAIRPANDSIKIFLYNSSYTAIDSIMVSTNTYGSFTAQFKLPAQALTGSYNILTRTSQTLPRATSYYGATTIQVEEYKRPKFYVSFDTLPGSYKLNDTIILTGKAKAYTGNPIANANVTYSITRQAHIPYQWLIKTNRLPLIQKTNIINGIVTTDEQGAFTIKFPASPNLNIARDIKPVFTFEATAAVTDLSGETREGLNTISIGYTPLQVTLNTPDIADTKNFTQISASVENLSGKTIPSNVSITVFPLEAPQRLIRQRYWDQPDQFVMSYNEYIRDFPNDEYKDENNRDTWPRKTATVKAVFSTAGKQAYTLNRSLPAGWYVIEAGVTDNNNDTIKDIKYIRIFDRSAKELPFADYNWSYDPQERNYAPGDSLHLLNGSSVNERFVIEYRQQGQNEPAPFSYHKIKKGQTEQTIRIQDKDCGGFRIARAFVYNNRMYTTYNDIKVAYPGKTLNVSYKTFRDKTTPGSKETWSIQVKTDTATTAQAELLTAMYDASLDQFRQHAWEIPDYWPASGYYQWNWQNGNNFESQESSEPYFPAPENDFQAYYNNQYSKLATSISDFNELIVGEEISYAPVTSSHVRGTEMVKFTPPAVSYDKEVDNRSARLRGSFAMPAPMPAGAMKQASMELKTFSANNPQEAQREATPDLSAENGNPGMPIQVRRQFNETAFFFPQLYAGKEGNYTFSFTIPEALTQWKWLSLAHTPSLAFGTQQQTITTQKSLMAQVNAPRFIRQGDKLTLIATISNLDTTALSGHVKLELLDPVTLQTIDAVLGNTTASRQFNTAAGQSSVLAFPLNIPANYQQAITYRITAEAGNFSDGEENTIPVLPNRTLVTETVPLQLSGNTTKNYRLEKLLQQQSNTLKTESLTLQQQSNTLKTESLTIEYTTNPAWQALQSLPYLVEYPYECAEQTFNRFYANRLAHFLIHRSPTFSNAFSLWQKDTAALLSNLEKEGSLKQLLLTETPWVNEAKNEREQKQRLVKLFITDANTNTSAALQQLQQMQQQDGSFSWFKGGQPDRYITTYIVTGMGKLQKLGALSLNKGANNICTAAIAYIDRQAAEEYKQLITRKADLKQNHLSSGAIQYLYARSFFKNIPFKDKTAYQFLLTQASTYWMKQNNYNKALLATVLYRNEKGAVAKDRILPSILEHAIADKENGMYWKDRITCFWHPSPIEHQSAIMMAVAEISKGYTASKLDSFYREMRTWLVLNKQTNNWGTTTATADACYALLADISELNSGRQVTIQIGDTTIQSAQQSTEAGTGYFSKRIEGAAVTPAMGNIKVSTYAKIPDARNQSNISYGAIYWQYFEDMNKITAPAGNPLSIEKKLFLQKTTEKENTLEDIAPNTTLKKGDRIVVQLVLKADRDMDYVHLKDMRAATMEPVDVLSGYKWTEGLGYYEANNDASTSFFIDHLRKGTYIVSYPVYLSHEGTFTAGIATASCMYAPSFNSHSESRQLQVKQ